jgi:hypothetical protein
MSESKYIKEIDAAFDNYVEGRLRHIRQEDYTAGAIWAAETIVRALYAEINRVSNPMMVDKEYLDGINAAIDIAKKFDE